MKEFLIYLGKRLIGVVAVIADIAVIILVLHLLYRGISGEFLSYYLWPLVVFGAIALGCSMLSWKWRKEIPLMEVLLDFLPWR